MGGKWVYFQGVDFEEHSLKKVLEHLCLLSCIASVKQRDEQDRGRQRRDGEKYYFTYNITLSL